MAQTFLVGAEKTNADGSVEQVYGWSAVTDEHTYIVFVERNGSLTAFCDGEMASTAVRKSATFRDLWCYATVNAGRVTAKYAKEGTKKAA